MNKPAAEITPVDDTGDHRIRVAAKRRQRMRARLLDAVLECHSSRADPGLPTAEEVARTAGVSRPTFYAHFNSVEDAVGELGEHLIDQMVTGLASIVDRESPLERITMGLCLFLMRSTIDPDWARFVARVVEIKPEMQFYKIARRDIEEAAKEGEIEVMDIDAAISIALGAMFAAIRHAHLTGERRREYLEAVVVMTLRSLGVETDRGASLVRLKSAQIRGLASDHIEWWRDPWA